jgi:PAS domain-containing protein
MIEQQKKTKPTLRRLQGKRFTKIAGRGYLDENPGELGNRKVENRAPKALADQKGYLDALQAERAKLEAITANAPVAIIVFDKNFRITFANATALTFTAMPFRPARGWTSLQLSIISPLRGLI